ncbi:helix-turn-helix transcriptional regulator [Palleronia pelagia]|uniref:helix-turn-helix transcriptional regulator n=1 Tax=Palleronia pelagia TaxID=387096 RepID=UPI0011144A30|nr:LuxR family transcriptional regulator [Palleronia pelagia]
MRDLWQVTLETLQAIGFSRVIYLTVDRDGRAPQLMTNLEAIYDLSNPAKDPFLQHCCSSYRITRTGVGFLDEHPYLGNRARAFIADAASHGFQTGLALPMRLTGSERYGGFNVGTGLTPEDFLRDIWPDREKVRFLCLIAHRRMEELAATPCGAQEFRELLIAPHQEQLHQLSPRETEMVYLLARGLSRKEVARMCGISPNTANDYIKSAYRKLGVSNRIEVVQMVQNGEI